jgi:hypothetical protein
MNRILAIAAVAACSKSNPPAQRDPAKQPGSQAEAPAAKPTPPQGPAPAAPPMRSTKDHIYCSDVLTAADVAWACGVALELRTPDNELDDIGPDESCSRSFRDDSGNSVTIMLLKTNRREMPPPETTWKNVQKLELGDTSIEYDDQNAGGDAEHAVTVYSRGLDVHLTAWNLGNRSAAACGTKLAALAEIAISRLPAP